MRGNSDENLCILDLAGLRPWLRKQRERTIALPATPDRPFHDNQNFQ
jgi:hypothetical protein